MEYFLVPVPQKEEKDVEINIKPVIKHGVRCKNCKTLTFTNLPDCTELCWCYQSHFLLVVGFRKPLSDHRRVIENR